MSEYLVLLDWSLGKSLSDVLYVFHFATFASVSGESFACVQPKRKVDLCLRLNQKLLPIRVKFLCNGLLLLRLLLLLT